MLKIMIQDIYILIIPLHSTVSVAMLVMVPSVFTATQATIPACISEAIVIISCPPVMLTPASLDVTLRLSSNHWNSAKGLASASHVNDTDEFSVTVASAGPRVIVGESKIED